MDPLCPRQNATDSTGNPGDIEMASVNYIVGDAGGKIVLGPITHAQSDIEVKAKGVKIRLENNIGENSKYLALTLSKGELDFLLQELTLVRNTYDMVMKAMGD